MRHHFMPVILSPPVVGLRIPAAKLGRCASLGFFACDQNRCARNSRTAQPAPGQSGPKALRTQFPGGDSESFEALDKSDQLQHFDSCHRCLQLESVMKC